MQTLINSLRSIVLFATIFTASTSIAATYTTLNAGAWNNTTNVWSTNGATPCGCTPGASAPGDDIIINHPLAMSYNLTFSGGSVITLNAIGSLTGGNDINMWNSTFDIFGNLSINKFTQGVNGNTTLHTAALMILSNQFTVVGGTFTNDGGLMNSGGIGIGVAATVTLLNASKLHCVSGNLVNSGTLIVGAGCCISSNGNWRNDASGNVSGFGSVYSGGNINNQGTWDPNIVWCSTGGDIGMVSPEDCATSTGVCLAIVLPVELVYFEAALNMNNSVELSWETASEYNSGYFILERSLDMENWTEIQQIEAAGFSSSSIEYSFTDRNPVAGDNYYRLVQIDNDGRVQDMQIRTIFVERDMDAISVYPNPAGASQPITIQNVDNGDIVSIVSMSGQIALQHMITTQTGSDRIDISMLTPGIYFIKTQRSDNNETLKLVVTK